MSFYTLAEREERTEKKRKERHLNLEIAQQVESEDYFLIYKSKSPLFANEYIFSKLWQFASLLSP